jgi:hypothetical protein
MVKQWYDRWDLRFSWYLLWRSLSFGTWRRVVWQPPTFPSSGQKNHSSTLKTEAECSTETLGRSQVLQPDDGGSTFLQKLVSILTGLPYYTVPQSEDRTFSDMYM